LSGIIQLSVSILLYTENVVSVVFEVVVVIIIIIIIIIVVVTVIIIVVVVVVIVVVVEEVVVVVVCMDAFRYVVNDFGININVTIVIAVQLIVLLLLYFILGPFHEPWNLALQVIIYEPLHYHSLSF